MAKESGCWGREAELAVCLSALAEMTVAGLDEEWRRLYGAPPPRMGRRSLELGVAWKLQERVHGGIGAAMKRRLAELARTMEEKGDLASTRAVKLKPGVRLMREWRGERHDVLVLEDGFQWRGRRWGSLSAVAREITGAHWSGPRFFGLEARKAKRGGAGGEAAAIETRDE